MHYHSTIWLNTDKLVDNIVTLNPTESNFNGSYNRNNSIILLLFKQTVILSIDVAFPSNYNFRGYSLQRTCNPRIHTQISSRSLGDFIDKDVWVLMLDSPSIHKLGCHMNNDGRNDGRFKKLTSISQDS